MSPNMFKSISLFGRKKSTSPIKDFYAEWIGTLKNTLLPLLRRSISTVSPSSNLLSTHVEIIHGHFQSYYDALDAAAEYDVAQLLFPVWRNSLEKPFLWIGDLHPYLFTNLLRSFIDRDEDDEDGEGLEEDDCREIDFGFNESREFFEKRWYVATAWRSPPEKLMVRIDQIECGLRLMVPALVARARNAQAMFIDRIGEEWGKEGSKSEIGEAMAAQMEEMVSVFKDANRLRRSVLAEIMGTTSIYQAALFFESLAQFLVGFRDRKLLDEFKGSKSVYQSVIS